MDVNGLYKPTYNIPESLQPSASSFFWAIQPLAPSVPVGDTHWKPRGLSRFQKNRQQATRFPGVCLIYMICIYIYILIILMYVHVCSMFLGVNHLREQESRLNTLDICRCTVQWLSWRPLRWSLHCMVEWLDDLGLEPWLKGTPHDPMCL